jgi:hypothetical protein
MYRLLPSSATVKMDYEEYMETARYATMTLLYEPNIESSCVVV